MGGARARQERRRLGAATLAALGRGDARHAGGGRAAADAGAAPPAPGPLVRGAVVQVGGLKVGVVGVGAAGSGAPDDVPVRSRPRPSAS